MKFSFIKDHRDRFDIGVMCSVFGVGPAGFHAWLKRPESARDTRARELSGAIRLIHHEASGVYGSLKVTKELGHRKQIVNRKTVAKLMARMRLCSKVRRRFRVRTTDSNHANLVAPNILDRKFAAATGPDQVWATDITYIHTDEGILYLAGVIDLYSRRIVGWSMDSTMTTQLALDALSSALLTRKPSLPLLHHSDRGVQYTSVRYRSLLQRHGIQASMSRTSDCYDNAVVESFWGKLKTELVYHERFKTSDEARAAIFNYIEGFYNRRRLHAALGYLSPEQFEARKCG